MLDLATNSSPFSGSFSRTLFRYRLIFIYRLIMEQTKKKKNNLQIPAFYMRDRAQMVNR